MHVADQLFTEAFEVEVATERVSPDTVFPDWSPLDRFGIVVTEPLGGLGASLLLQLAIAMFYSVRPERRAGTAMYPEIYLFEVAPSVRDQVAGALAARVSSGELSEVYQRITTAESLAYIAGRF